MIQIVGLKGIPIIKEQDNIVKIILKSLNKMEIKLDDGDILVIAHTIISRIEGRIKDLRSIVPTQEALEIAHDLNNTKDPRLITLILEESKEVLRTAIIDGVGKVIVENNLGFICANAGIDQSNTPDNLITLLPLDPDKTAARICTEISKETGKDVAVVISDTHGRPFRKGAINVAIGVAGINEIKDYRGKVDLFNYQLQKTQVAIADELASAAELIMGQAGEGFPIILIRGYDYDNQDGSARGLIRPADRDLFR